jgi:hypothetical protein
MMAIMTRLLFVSYEALQGTDCDKCLQHSRRVCCGVTVAEPHIQGVLYRCSAQTLRALHLDVPQMKRIATSGGLIINAPCLLTS